MSENTRASKKSNFTKEHESVQNVPNFDFQGDATENKGLPGKIQQTSRNGRRRKPES